MLRKMRKGKRLDRKHDSVYGKCRIPLYVQIRISKTPKST